MSRAATNDLTSQSGELTGMVTVGHNGDEVLCKSVMTKEGETERPSFSASSARLMLHQSAVQD